MMLKVSIIFLLIISVFTLQAQDTLPNFKVVDLGKNRIQVSWINNYPNLTQLTVQRSFDSAKNFRTIFSAQSAWLPNNGFIDTKITSGARVYYRIYYVQDSVNYAFTKSKRARPLTLENNLQPIKEIDPASTLVTIRLKNTLFAQYAYENYILFRDSIINTTRDTLVIVSPNEAILKPFGKTLPWKPSNTIYTNKNGYVSIILPKAKERKYRIVFKDADENIIFEIKQVKETELQLDKSNFIHSGWFMFDLYEDGVLKEKNRFLLAKDF